MKKLEKFRSQALTSAEKINLNGGNKVGESCTCLLGDANGVVSQGYCNCVDRNTGSSYKLNIN